MQTVRRTFNTKNRLKIAGARYTPDKKERIEIKKK